MNEEEIDLLIKIQKYLPIAQQIACNMEEEVEFQNISEN